MIQFRLWQLIMIPVAVGLFILPFRLQSLPLALLAWIVCGALSGMTITGGGSREIRAIAAMVGAVVILPVLFAVGFLLLAIGGYLN